MMLWNTIMPIKNWEMENGNRHLRILFNAVSAKSGGSAVYMMNLFRSLSHKNNGHDFVFLVPPRLANEFGDSSNHIQVIPTEAGLGSPWKRFFWDQVILRRIAKEQRIDVLVATSDYGMLFPPCRQLLMIGNSLFFSSFYIKQILPRKSLKFKLQFLLRQWLISLSTRFSKIVVAPSQSLLAIINRSIGGLGGKLSWNYLGVPLAQFSVHRLPVSEDARESGDRPFQILYVSEYSDYKNLTVLLKAVILLREQEENNFRLVTTADPRQFPEVEIATREEDQALAADPWVASSVKFTGSVPYEDVPELYRQSDLFVFPSLAESFGYPLVEAMTVGLPIIASDIPICREICGEAAVYFSPQDPLALVQQVILLRNDPDLRKQLGEAGRRRAMELFDWDHHVDRLVKLVDLIAREG